MFKRLQELSLRGAATLTPWIALATLVTLLDFQQRTSSEVVILHLAVVLAAFQLTARRNLPRLMIVTQILVWLPWILSTDRGAAWDRVWITICLLLAGLYHAGNQHRRQRRLFIRKQLQQNVRGRTLQLQQANEALREEIAARQATQYRLDRAQTHLHSLAQRMQLQVLRKDTQGVITYANEAFCQAISRTPQEVIGSTDADLYPEAVAAKYRVDDEFVLRTGSTIDHIESHPAADGQTGWVQVFKAPELDANQQITGIQIIFWDVTDRHRQTAELRRSEARKRALFNASREAVLLVDDEGVVVEANSSAVSLLGHVGLPLAGVRLADLAMLHRPPAGQTDDAANGDARNPLAATGSDTEESARTHLRWADIAYGVRRQISLKPAGKSAFPAEVSVHPIPLDTSTGLAIFVRDVTLQQRALAAMREGKLAAEKASQIKSQFMASVSHEVRTPLGGILGSADLLAEMPLPPRAQQYIEMIQHSGQLLSNVIGDILDLASIEAGRLQITNEPIDFHRCIGEAFRSLATRAIGKDLELVLDIHADVPRFLQGDPKRLRQIVINLVGNAIKFTPQGFVRLRATVEGEAGLVIAVSDSGVGIPAEHLDKIFEPFEQGDSGTTRRFGGTGLGLSISQQLVTRMGGSIDVESVVQQGTTFRCHLPLLRCPPADGYQPPGPLPAEVGLQVDQPQQRQAIERWLTSRGVKINAASPLQIIDVRSQSQSNDGQQSEHDLSVRQRAGQGRGAGAAQRVLWLARVDDPSPPSELRAPSDPSSETNAAATVLLKPILPDDLLRWLSGAQAGSFPLPAPSRQATAVASPATNVAAADSSGPRLLLADDSPVNQAVIRDFLAAAGYQVTVVGDGHAAVAAAAADQRFACVLMDLQMPGMDGIEAMQRIVQQDQAAGRTSPPFIALTAHATDEHRRRCLAAGMKAFLVKPIDRRELVRTVANWIPATPAGRVESTGEETPVPPSQIASVPIGDGTPTSAANDWPQRLLRAAGNDPNTAGLLTDAFLEEVPHLIRQLSTALDADDAKTARRAAHTLKSCLKYVADQADWKLAEDCEKAAAAGELDAVRTQLPELTTLANLWVQRLADSRRS